MIKRILIPVLLFLSLSAISQTKKQKEIEHIAYEWAAANTEHDIERLKPLYASSVVFYALAKDAATCMQEKAVFFEKNSGYSISISDLDIDFYKSGIVKCNFTKHEIWNGKARKPQQGYLLFEKKGKNYFITGESDQRMDTQRGYSPQLGAKVERSSSITYMLIGAAALLLILAIGYFVRKNVVQKRKSDSVPMLYSQPVNNETAVEIPTFTEEKLKQDNGLAFEQYIVKNFDKAYFTLLHWRGDKYIDGHYPLSNLEPDLDFMYQDTARKESFAIECKWRRGFTNNAITLAEERQLTNYRNYQAEKNYPVFIVLGVGGTGSQPEDVYIIPLNEITSPVITKERLGKYYRYKKGKFFLEIPAMRLQ